MKKTSFIFPIPPNASIMIYHDFSDWHSQLLNYGKELISNHKILKHLGQAIKDLGTIKSTTYPLNEQLSHRGDYKNSTIVPDRFFTDMTHTGQVNITKLDK